MVLLGVTVVLLCEVTMVVAMMVAKCDCSVFTRLLLWCC